MRRGMLACWMSDCSERAKANMIAIDVKPIGLRSPAMANSVLTKLPSFCEPRK